MRFERTEHILHLCVMMASRAQGVSLTMIMDEFVVSRRTAERMRDAALRVLPIYQERTDETGTKFWSASDLPRGFADANAEEIAALNAAIDLAAANNQVETVRSLRSIADKLLAQQGRKRQVRLEPDIELLLQSEGLALRPGPKISLNPQHVAVIREAILSSRRILLSYLSRAAEARNRLTLEPLGILYGPRPYLIAKQKDDSIIKHYRLHGIENPTVTNEGFDRKLDFDLRLYAKKLFGVFNEEPSKVHWRFRADAANAAAEFQFHPDQAVEVLEDGTLDVRFEAAGLLEMAWHLYAWGDAVDVLAPLRLREMVKDYQRSDFEALP